MGSWFGEIFLRNYLTKVLKYFCDLAKIFLPIRKGDTKMDVFAHCVLSRLLNIAETLKCFVYNF